MKIERNRWTRGVGIACLIAVLCLVLWGLTAVSATAWADEMHNAADIPTQTGNEIGVTDTGGAAENGGIVLADSADKTSREGKSVTAADAQVNIEDTENSDTAGAIGGVATDEQTGGSGDRTSDTATPSKGGQPSVELTAASDDTAGLDAEQAGDEVPTMGAEQNTVPSVPDEKPSAELNSTPTAASGDTTELDTEEAAKKWLHEQLPATLASWLSVVLGAVTAIAVTLGKVKKVHGSLTESVNKMQDVKAEWLNSSEEWRKAKDLYEQTAACMKEVAEESREAWRLVDEWRKETKAGLDKLAKGVKLGLCNTEELVAKGYAKDIAAALSDTPPSTELPNRSA